ncbi:MAG: hypothetical protein WC959_01230 [Kiritimatiellales bacterium]
MRGLKVSAWERRLKTVFDQIDAELENEYGGRYELHPARPPRGKTANPEDDGLFNVGAAFSAGFGSKYGPGYVVDIRIATLEKVPAKVREKIKHKVVKKLKRRLPDAFPGKILHVAEEPNGTIRIHGDLSLDSI